MLNRCLTDSQIVSTKHYARRGAELTLLLTLLSMAAGWYFNEAVRRYNEREQAVERIETAEQAALISAQRADILAGTLKPRFVCKWAVDPDTGGKHLEIIDITADTKDLLGVPKEALIGKSPEILIPPESDWLKKHKKATTASELLPSSAERSYEAVIKRLDNEDLRTPVLITIWPLPGEIFSARILVKGKTYNVRDGANP